MKRIFFLPFLFVMSQHLYASTLEPMPDETIQEVEQNSWLVEGLDALHEIDPVIGPETSCRKLSSKFTDNALSSLQKEREWEQYEGKYIEITGVLEDVDRIPLIGGYGAIFSCHDSDSLLYDYTVSIPSTLEEYAFSLNPGEEYTLVVRLSGYGEMLGIRAELIESRIETHDGDTCHMMAERIHDGHIRFQCRDMDTVAFTKQRRDDSHVYTAHNEIEAGPLYFVSAHSNSFTFVDVRGENFHSAIISNQNVACSFTAAGEEEMMSALHAISDSTFLEIIKPEITKLTEGEISHKEFSDFSHSLGTGDLSPEECLLQLVMYQESLNYLD